jgi:hypothetical protein
LRAKFDSEVLARDINEDDGDQYSPFGDWLQDLT